MIGQRKPAPEAISELLEAQKDALLRGDLTQLGQIERPLERAFGRLRSEKVPLQDLARIKHSATRNAALLAAAQAGLASAREQIKARRSENLTVYDVNGRSQSTSPGPSRLLSRS